MIFNTEQRSPFKRILLLSAALHGALLVALGYYLVAPKDHLQRAPTARVSLGLRASTAGQIAQQQVVPQQAQQANQQPEAPEPPDIEQVKANTLEKSKPVEKIKPKQTDKPIDKPKPVEQKVVPIKQKKVDPVAPTPEPAVQKTAEPEPVKPDPAPPETPEPVEETPKPQQTENVSPQSAQQAQVAGAGGINGSTQNLHKQQETGQQDQFTGDANSARYDAELRQHLMNAKRYPRSLKMKRKEGSVEVLFSINKQGELLSQKIVKRSGDRVFDRTIKRLFARATPLPPPPAETRWETREYRLRFTYQLD